MITYDLTLRIEYEFSPPAGAGRQHLRILPAILPLQQEVRNLELTITPDPAERSEFVDFFGTRVIEISQPAGLNSMSFMLRTKVDRRAVHIGADVSARLTHLYDEVAAYRGLDAGAPHHFLVSSPRITADSAIADFARDATSKAVTAHAAVFSLGRAIHDLVAFDPSATEVDTPPEVAFAQRRGVCQDFAQIMICGLRSIGIPAAYVSGYLRTVPPAGQERLVGADAMHAWVQAWTGLESGWLEYDPTNACLAGDGHLRIGFGRDYGDVAPVAGMLRLGGGQVGRHSVDLVPMNLMK